MRETDAAGSGYSSDMAVCSLRNEPSGFVRSAMFGRSVKVPRLSRSAQCRVVCQLMCDAVIGRLSAFDPTRESRNLFQRNFIFQVIHPAVCKIN